MKFSSSKKKKLRKEQYSLMKEGSYMMKDILEILYKRKKDMTITVTIILQRIKLMLDDKTRAYMPSLTMRCHALWNDLNKTRLSPTKTGTQLAEIKMIEEEFHKAEKARHSASLGLEHFLREISQIYEAKKAAENPVKTYFQHTRSVDLSEVMAGQIVKGMPFEIMDGDTGCIPIDWLRAVFDQLKKILKDKRIFVLTALGIQSSGKSTLLNFMFGLQFAVSAGRCTRGIFAQLCKVDTTACNFDYILVVDTEGLRAPELGQHNYDHDNELAMLVLGLGDLTIVNFKGESTTEIRDVLQTAVHAFIKLKIANKCKDLKQQCIFIYQNVPSTTAKEKILMAQQRLEDTLDEMTQIAANIESRPDITSFKQVIKFEGEKHFSTFADLWQGEAPMNSVNPGYISDVAHVKECILQVFMERKNSNITIEDIFLRMKDLWDGMLSMDFVFSFRNSLEMKAYDLLESEYRKHICTVEEKVTNWYCEMGQPEILHAHSTAEITHTKKNVELNLNIIVENESKSAWLKLNDFIQNDEIMLDWEFSKQTKFQNEMKEIQSRQKHNIEKDVSIQTIDARSREEKSRILLKLSRKAEEIAKTQQFTTDDEKALRLAFDDIWDRIMTDMEILPSYRYAKLSVKESFQDVLAQHLMRDGNLLREFLPLEPYVETNPLPDCIQPSNVTDADLHILDKKWSFSHCQHLALNKIKSIMKKIDMYIDGKRKTTCQFQRDFANHIIQDLLASLKKHNDDDSQLFLFQPTLKVKLCVEVSLHAITFFEKKESEYDKFYGFTAKLASWKEMNWQMFTDTVAKKREEIIVARYITNVLKPSIKAAVERQMTVFASNTMKSSFHTKQKLIRTILEDIADKETFGSISHYLDDDTTFAQTWIAAMIDKSLFQRRPDGSTIYAHKAKVILSELIDKIKETVLKPTKDVMNLNLKTWLTAFKKNLDRRIIYGDDLEFVSDKHIENFSHFGKQLHEYLDNTEADLYKEFMCVTAKSVQWVNSYPYDNGFKWIWGCNARCSFCLETCYHSDAGHLDNGIKHETNQHRPNGMDGVYWTKSAELVWNNCSHNVSCSVNFECFDLCVTEGTCPEVHETSHPFEYYKSIFPDWLITPTPDVKCAKYWMWIVCTFKKEFEQKFDMKWSAIPKGWTKLNKSAAKDSLKQAYEF